MATPFQVTVDCVDPAAQAKFWAAVLHYELQPPPEGFPDWPAFLRERGVPEEQWDASSAIVDPDKRGPRMYFQKVPEAKAVKNRIHLDLNISTGTTAAERRRDLEAEVERALRLGASEVGRVEEGDEYWVVLRDPEGNEFCMQ